MTFADLHVRPEHGSAALKAARDGAGGGGQRRRGHGDARVRVERRHRHVLAPPGRALGGYTVGVLVQSNYGGVLTMGGAPVGKGLGRYAYQPSAAGAPPATTRRWLLHDRRRDRRAARRPRPEAAGGTRGVRPGPHRFVVQQRQRRFRDRVFDGGRRCACGSATNGAAARTLLPTDGVSPLFQAALEATEEAVYNSLLKATTVTSSVGTAEALPIARVREILAPYQAPRRRLVPFIYDGDAGPRRPSSLHGETEVA